MKNNNFTVLSILYCLLYPSSVCLCVDYRVSGTFYVGVSACMPQHRPVFHKFRHFLNENAQPTNNGKKQHKAW